MPAKGGRSRRQLVESPPQTVESSGLKFNQALSWTVGRPIAEADLVRRLQALYTEISSKDQDDVDLDPLRPIAKDLANERLLKHKNRGVQSWAACCIVEIIRLFAPNAPYTGKELKNIFTAIIEHVIPSLADSSSPYHGQHLAVVKSLKDIQSILLITDVPSSAYLTRALFTACFDVLSGNTSEVSINVAHNLTALLIELVSEAPNLSDEVIDIVLAQFLRADPRSHLNTTTAKGKKQHGPVDEKQATLLLKEAPPAYTMAQDICIACGDKMARYVLRYFSSILADTSLALSESAARKSGQRKGDQDDDDLAHGSTEEELKESKKAHLLLRELWRAAHEVLQEIVPQLEAELSTDNTHIRLMAVEAVGDMIAGIGASGPPVPPTLDPAAYPSQSLADDSENRPYHFLLTPASATSFIARHLSTYEAFLNRRKDKSPVIRAAWATAVGRIILYSVGGRGFNSEDQRVEILRYFADTLVDTDERVRLSAVKVLEEYTLRSVVLKLGEVGGIGQQGSILANLGDRVKDRKIAIGAVAIPLLAKLWGVAAGAIAAGDRRVKDLLGGIPDTLFNAYYVQEPEIHKSLDKALFESLVPLTFPVKMRQNGSEAHNSQAPTKPVEAEPDADRLRAERILILINSLEPKSRAAFFSKQRQQPQTSKLVLAFLETCEIYNGGIVDPESGKSEKDVKARLMRFVTVFAHSFPDRQRAMDDLMKFAKQHDRRCYSLIRFCCSPESDWSRIRKSIKELAKRIEDSTSSASQSSLPDTLLSLIYRCSVLIYNRSNLPNFSHFARSDEKELGATAHEVLNEISQVQGEVFSTHIKQLCETLTVDAPSNSKSHGPGAVDDLKACARFALNFPEKVPNNPKFFSSLMAFVKHGQPRAAKYAARILLTSSSKKEMYAKDIYSSCAPDFVVDKSGFLSKLSALSQLMFYGGQHLEPEEVDTVVDIAINRILMRKDAVSTSESDHNEEWTDEPDEKIQGKVWALKILVNRLRTYPEAEDVSEAADPVYSFLNTIIARHGHLGTDDSVPEVHASRLRLSAAVSFLKLCGEPRYNQRLRPVMFNRLCLTAQDQVLPVREGFVKKVMKYLGQVKLPRRFYTPLFLLAFEPNANLKMTTENWIRSRIQLLVRDKETSLELIIARLISLLAHHPDFDTDEDALQTSLKEMAQYIIFYLQAVATSENISLIFYVSQRIKNVSDGIDKSSSNIYILSDLAQAIIRRWHEKQGWNMQTWPGKLNLPAGIFAPIESHEKAVRVASKIFLPADIPEVLDQLIQESFSRSKLSKKKARPMNGAAKSKKRPRPASEAKQAGPSSKKMRPQKTPKRKSVDEDFEMAVSLSERRRSGRNREVKNYREMSEDENDSAAPQLSSSRHGAAKVKSPGSGARGKAVAEDSDILSLDSDMSD